MGVPVWKRQLRTAKGVEALRGLELLLENLSSTADYARETSATRVANATTFAKAHYLLSGSKSGWVNFLKLRADTGSNLFGKEAKAVRDAGFRPIFPPPGPPPYLQSLETTLDIIIGLDACNKVQRANPDALDAAEPSVAPAAERFDRDNRLAGPSAVGSRWGGTRPSGGGAPSAARSQFGSASRAPSTRNDDGFGGRLARKVKDYLQDKDIRWESDDCWSCLYLGKKQQAPHTMYGCPSFKSGDLAVAAGLVRAKGSSGRDRERDRDRDSRRR